MSRIRKATKQAAKMRAALFGPPGAGKTFTALRIATGLGGRIGAIDSEEGSIELYADRFDFDCLPLGPKERSIHDYVKAIREFAREGHEVLIIDSLSHAWQELIAEVEKIAKAKYRGNTFSAWSEGTPLQRELVDAILTYPGHVIATMRSKVAYEITKNDRGKSSPDRIGLAPEQGKGIEYEFGVLFELNTDHTLTCIKDRTGRFQDRIIQKPGEELGRELAAWLSEGADPAKVAAERAEAARLAEEQSEADASLGELAEWWGKFLIGVRSRWDKTTKAEPVLAVHTVDGLPGSEGAILKALAEGLEINTPNTPGPALTPFVSAWQADPDRFAAEAKAAVAEKVAEIREGLNAELSPAEPSSAG